MIIYIQLLARPEVPFEYELFSRGGGIMRKAKGVIIERCGAKSTFYFRNGSLQREPFEAAIKKAMHRKQCSYGETNNICFGEISINFNPAKHSRKTRKQLEESLKQLIEESI